MKIYKYFTKELGKENRNLPFEKKFTKKSKKNFDEKSEKYRCQIHARERKKCGF